MEKALEEVKRFRNSSQREVESSLAKIETYKKTIVEMEEIIKREKEKIAGFDEILKRLEGEQ